MNEEKSHGNETINNDLESLTAFIVVLIGQYVLENEKNQHSLLWGKQPTAIQTLLALPFEYFSDAHKKHILLPTIIAICYKNEHGLAVMKTEMNPVMLKDYINQEKEDFEKMCSSSENDHINQDCATKDISEPNVCPMPFWMKLQNRFPPRLWRNAILYFSE